MRLCRASLRSRSSGGHDLAPHQTQLPNGLEPLCTSRDLIHHRGPGICPLKAHSLESLKLLQGARHPILLGPQSTTFSPDLSWPCSTSPSAGDPMERKASPSSGTAGFLALEGAGGFSPTAWVFSSTAFSCSRDFFCAFFLFFFGGPAASERRLLLAKTQN